MMEKSPGPWWLPQKGVRDNWATLWQWQSFSRQCLLVPLLPCLPECSTSAPVCSLASPFPRILIPPPLSGPHHCCRHVAGMLLAWPFPLGCPCHTGQVASGLGRPHAVFSSGAERRRCLVPQPQSLVRKKLKATQFWLISL